MTEDKDEEILDAEILSSLEDTPSLEEIQIAEQMYLSSLTHEEQDELKTIRYDLNDNLNWKKITGDASDVLDSMVSEFLFDTQVPGKKTPEENLFPDQQEFLRDRKNDGFKEELRVRYIRLLFVKKLLGALKTQVRKELETIQLLSFDESNKLLDLLERAAELSEPSTLDQEIDLRVEESMKLPPRGIPEGGIPLSDLSEEEVMEFFNGSTDPEECGHEHTKTVYISGTVISTCKLCDKVLPEDDDVVGIEEMGKKKKKKAKHYSQYCSHKYVEWVPGKEGQDARCLSCQQLIENPGKYSWSSAGLEPYLDDPTKDEVILLAEYMAEAPKKEVQE